MNKEIIEQSDTQQPTHPAEPAVTSTDSISQSPTSTSEEIGGRGGLEPTRYGDWEKNGRCIDF
ncbi:MAG: DUF1674 domain-containing protein [Xanthomonadales bacterium]|jgi:hypothetical protein|nr:DUF1674 domain-containing protein [Xanthomonadales bacterium]